MHKRIINVFLAVFILIPCEKWRPFGTFDPYLDSEMHPGAQEAGPRVKRQTRVSHFQCSGFSLSGLSPTWKLQWILVGQGWIAFPFYRWKNWAQNSRAGPDPYFLPRIPFTPSCLPGLAFFDFQKFKHQAEAWLPQKRVKMGWGMGWAEEATVLIFKLPAA